MYACVPIMMDPLLAGERKPITAHKIIRKAHMINCMPVPTMTYIGSESHSRRRSEVISKKCLVDAGVVSKKCVVSSNY